MCDRCEPLHLQIRGCMILVAINVSSNIGCNGVVCVVPMGGHGNTRIMPGKREAGDNSGRRHDCCTVLPVLLV